MEIFRDLYINIDSNRMGAALNEIEQALPAGWTRDRAAEERLRSRAVLKSGPTFCFNCSAEEQRPAAMLVLTQQDAATFFVSNIVPLAKHQLEHGEYNAILEDFYERIIRPYAKTAGVLTTLGDGQVDLEYWMTPATAGLLRQFSAGATKRTGAAHPADRERWNAFVVAAHRDRSKISATNLRRWLIEVDGWPPEVAHQLAIEYESGRELLAYADGRRSA